MSGRNSRSVGLVDCSFVPSSPPSRDQLVRHIALRKKQNGKASKMRLFSLYLPLNITHHADFAHLCSVFSAGSLNVIGYIQQKRHVFIHFARSCSLSLSSTQFFREIHFILLVSPHAPYIRVVLCFCFWV